MSLKTSTAAQREPGGRGSEERGKVRSNGMGNPLLCLRLGRINEHLREGEK